MILIGRRAWEKAMAKLDTIGKTTDETAKSVKVLNQEYGRTERDVGWLKWLTGVILAVIIGTAFTLIWKALGA